MLDLFISYAPTVATIFFFLTFCYIVFSVFKKGSKQKFDQYSEIPLKDKEQISNTKNN